MNLQKSVVVAMLAVAGVLNMAEWSVADDINWTHNLYESWLQAQREKKPLVVYFSCNCDEEVCWGRRLDQEVLKTGTLDGFANQAIFVEARPKDEDDHDNYAQLKTDLDISRAPSFVLLDVRPDSMSECGRIIGFLKPQEYHASVAKLFESWDERHPEVIRPVNVENSLIPQGWSSYLNRGLGFQATFPSEPSVVLVDDASQTFKVRSTVPGEGQEYTIHVQDLSPDLRGDSEAGKWLRGWANACAVAEQGAATDVTLLDHSVSTACQFHIVNDAGRRIFAVRVLLDGTRLYTLRAKIDGDEAADLPAQFFLQSFNPIRQPEQVAVVESPTP